MTGRLKFSKMHGLGNDFVVIDNTQQRYPELTLAQRQWIADRHRGIGCDQLLLVESAVDKAIDFRYRIFNADGGEVSQCGNGARCFARYVVEKGLTAKSEVTVQTHSGVIQLFLRQDGQVTVDMGCPIWQPSQIPFVAAEQQPSYTLKWDAGCEQQIAVVSMGNPHAVLLVDDITTADVETIGPRIAGHLAFPEGVNVGFMEILSDKAIRLRVYERGVGETQACGTGACAAAVIAIAYYQLAPVVAVALTGGALEVAWQGEGMPVMMTGPASFVFDGELPWPAI